VRRPRLQWTIGAILLGGAGSPATGWAQGTAAPPPAASQAAQSPDPDRTLTPGEPDFTLAALPTSLRLPRGAFVFRITHRFTRPLNEGSAGDFFADFFGLDSAARIGLELRYGVRPGTQVIAHRTGDRSIQLAGQQQILGQRDGDPIGLDALVGVDGQNNFSEDFAFVLGAIVSRQLGSRGALYAHPLIVLRSNSDPAATGADDRTAIVGLGGRLRLGETRVYVVVEAAPRVRGHDPGVDHVSLGIEKRAGGHVFQLNVSNALGTTLRQVALGGPSPRAWFLGFNLTRKFY